MWQFTVLFFSVALFGGLGWWLSPCAEVRIRYIGLGCELAGIATVALGLLERHGLFEIPSPLNAAWHWLKQWWEPRRHVIVAGTGTIRATGAAFGRLSVGLGPDATLEQRVAGLETKVAALESGQGQLSTAVTQETAKREEALALERQDRNDADTRLQNRIQALGAGNLHLEWLGIIFLVFGVVLATASNEIASWFSDCPTPTPLHLMKYHHIAGRV